MIIAHGDLEPRSRAPTGQSVSNATDRLALEMPRNRRRFVHKDLVSTPETGDGRGIPVSVSEADQRSMSALAPLFWYERT